MEVILREANNANALPVVLTEVSNANALAIASEVGNANALTVILSEVSSANEVEGSRTASRKRSRYRFRAREAAPIAPVQEPPQGVVKLRVEGFRLTIATKTILTFLRERAGV